MIVSLPGQDAPGSQTDAFVEFVDIFPTLSDACNLPFLPELEGLSMLPVIENPILSWKTAAFSQFKQIRSIRTDQYRYSKSENSEELYDYTLDSYSEENVAEIPEYSGIVKHLRDRLYAGWKQELPVDVSHYTRQKTLIWDVNNDGVVDMHDLIIVSNNFGREEFTNPKVDVNLDGCVNIVDLLLVVAHFGESSNASAPAEGVSFAQQHADTISKWLIEAYQQDDGSAVFRDGIESLESLMENILPKQTGLLPNYPNPFNPETWIPYDLVQDANVQIEIYNLSGELINKLNVGHQKPETIVVNSRQLIGMVGILSENLSQVESIFIHLMQDIFRQYVA